MSGNRALLLRVRFVWKALRRLTRVVGRSEKIRQGYERLFTGAGAAIGGLSLIAISLVALFGSEDTTMLLGYWCVTALLLFRRAEVPR